MLVKTAGVKHLVILINKMDDPTVKWDIKRLVWLYFVYLGRYMFLYVRYDYCKDQLTPYLKRVGFNPSKDIQFMPCSGLTGAGLMAPVGADAPWYT